MDSFNLQAGDYPSAAAHQLREGFANLRFAGPLEKEFREAHIETMRPRGRVAGQLALLLLLGLACIDFLVRGKPSIDSVNGLRLGAAVPLIACFLIASYHPALAKHYLRLAAGATAGVGLIVVYYCIQSALTGDSYILAGLVLVIIYGCLFLGLLFNTVVALSTLLVVGYGIMGYLTPMPDPELLYALAILTAAAIVGALGAYNLEYAQRMGFLETRLLNELAQRDGLTGLYNRRIFDDYIRRLWRQARRETAPLAFVFVDIDYFKVYNDLYGHQAGDDCLKRVANTIASVAKRPFDFAARYGGEEFVVVLYGPPKDYAESLPKQIRRDVAAISIPHDGSEVASHVTVSVGVAIVQATVGRSLAGAIQLADEALYEAKEQGRNRVVVKDAAITEIHTGSFRAAPSSMAG